METYFESADGIEISKERAIIELKRHGVTEQTDFNQFFLDMGTKAAYNAQEVLGWLGY